MPFKSEKQRRFLWLKKPKMARKWADEAKKQKKPIEKAFDGSWSNGRARIMRLRNPFKDKQEKTPAKEHTTIEYPHYGQIKQDYDPDDPTAVSQYRQGRQVLVHGVESTPQQTERYRTLEGKAGQPVRAHYKKQKMVRWDKAVHGGPKPSTNNYGEMSVPTGDWIARDPRAIRADEKTRVKDYQQFEQYRQKTYGKQIKSPEGMVHKSAFGVEYKRDAKGRFATIDTRTAKRAQGQYKFVNDPKWNQQINYDLDEIVRQSPYENQPDWIYREQTAANHMYSKWLDSPSGPYSESYGDMEGTTEVGGYLNWLMGQGEYQIKYPTSAKYEGAGTKLISQTDVDFYNSLSPDGQRAWIKEMAPYEADKRKIAQGVIEKNPNWKTESLPREDMWTKKPLKKITSTPAKPLPAKEVETMDRWNSDKNFSNYRSEDEPAWTGNFEKDKPYIVKSVDALKSNTRMWANEEKKKKSAFGVIQ